MTAPAHTAIGYDVGAPAHGVGNLWQQVDDGHGAVELPPAMIGDPDRICADLDGVPVPQPNSNTSLSGVRYFRVIASFCS